MGCTLFRTVRRWCVWVSPLAILLAAGVELRAQDLGQVGKKSAFSLTGGLNAYAGVYTTDLADPNMVPFTWGLSGRITIGISELQLPFTFIISEKERSFRQPFNQFGVSPRYKWATAHIGHRTMHLSELTMSGQRFFGGGLELNPGRFRFAAMYGSLRREVFADTLTEAYVEPAFARHGMAMKLGMGTLSDHVDLVLFRAKDRYDPLAYERGDYGLVQPEENLVIGIESAFRVAKNLQWQLDAAGSLHNMGFVPATRERGATELSNAYDSFLFNVDQRTRRGTAVKTGLSYNLQGVTFSLNYDRIDPLFRTLGNYFFLNDVENYRGAVAFGILKRKLRVALSAGLQSNDLSKALAARTKRTIGSVTLSYNSGKVYSATLAYSNFEADLRTTYEAAGADTLRFRQVSDNLTLTNAFRLRNTDRGITRMVDVTLGYQGFVNEGTPAQPVTTTTAWTGSFGFRTTVKERALSWGIRGSWNRFSGQGLDRTRYGLSVNGRTGFNNDRTGVNARFAAYLNDRSDRSAGTSLVLNAGVDQRVARMHRVGFTVGYNARTGGLVVGSDNYQLRAQVTYGLDFNALQRKPQQP